MARCFSACASGGPAGAKRLPFLYAGFDKQALSLISTCSDVVDNATALGLMTMEPRSMGFSSAAVFAIRFRGGSPHHRSYSGQSQSEFS